MSQAISFTAAPTYGAIPPSEPRPKSGSRFGYLQKWLKFRSPRSAKLWILYGTVMTLMFIARIPYIFPNGFELNLSREEYFYYSIPSNKYPLFIHLVAVLPAGLLAVFQFVPRIRYHFISYHRITGRVINTLTVISTISAWFIARVSFGGDLSIQLGVYTLGAMTIYSMIASWRAIRRLQIDKHREWIIRAWGYQMSVVTLRLLMFLGIAVTGSTGRHYTVCQSTTPANADPNTEPQTMSCAEVANSLNDSAVFVQEYPQCLPGWSGKPVTHLSIEAGLDSDLAIAAGAQVTFGASIWVALWIHAIIIEYYLTRTKDESARLRDISTKRQNIRRGPLALG